MYENVRRTKGPGLYRLRGNLFLTGGILACVAVAVLVIGLVVYAGWYQLRFRSFLRDLSDSTIYAYDNHTLRAEGNGQSVRVSGDNAYAIYRGMSAWSPTGLPRRLPAGEADLALDYGEGTCLQVWIWKEKNGQPKAHGLSVLLETGAGERFVLEFGSASISPLERWTAADAIGNELWA